MDEIIRQLYYGELNPIKNLPEHRCKNGETQADPEDAFCEGFRMGMQFMLATLTT